MSYNLDYPQSRTEKILMNILEAIGGGGGTSINSEDILKIKDYLGYNQTLKDADKHFYIFNEDVDPIDTQGLCHFQISGIIVFEDGIETDNHRQFFDFINYDISEYENIIWWYNNDNQSSAILGEEIVNSFDQDLKSLDPDNGSAGYSVYFAVGQDWATEMPEGVNPKFSGIYFDFFGQISSTYYPSIYQIILGVFDEIKSINALSYTKKSEDSLDIETNMR